MPGPNAQDQIVMQKVQNPILPEQEINQASVAA